MASNDRGSSFPARGGATIRVDSRAEIVAFVQAYPSPAGPWRESGRTILTGREASRLSVALGDPADSETVLSFDVSSFAGGEGVERLGGWTTEVLDRLMRTAVEFAAANPPHHPGSVPRFPVPSARYPGRVEVPLAILAVEEGSPGLYAPPRVATVGYATGEGDAVGEFPGFDPDDWPPPRLGPWPPAGTAGREPVALQGALSRLSGCLVRLLDAWTTEADYPHRPDDAAESLALLAILDEPRMGLFYDRLNAPFRRWLATSAAELGDRRGE